MSPVLPSVALMLAARKPEPPAEDTIAPAPAATVAEPGKAADEFKSVCEFMRLYATMRFYRLALLLGTTGSIVTALTSQAVQANFARVEVLKAGGLMISLAFLVMEFRATSHWLFLCERFNGIAATLGFHPYPGTSRWSPLTTSGASFYLYSLVPLLWCASLLLRF